jgi:hypothetical protein
MLNRLRLCFHADSVTVIGCHATLLTLAILQNRLRPVVPALFPVHTPPSSDLPGGSGAPAYAGASGPPWQGPPLIFKCAVMTSALAERTLSLLVFGRLPDRVCDREPTGIASELGGFVGSAPEGGIIERQVFEKVSLWGSVLEFRI